MSLGFLEYSFIETVEAMHPFYIIRAGWRCLFVTGSLIMAYNLWMTVRHGEAEGSRRRAGSRPPPCLRRIRGGTDGHGKNTKSSRRTRSVPVIGILVTVSIGGLVEIAPLFYLESTIEKVEGMRPYTPLELAGRDIYIREGCYVCHSQMVRPMR
jgi:hypothetical protein